MTNEIDTPKINLPQFSVSEISHAIKNTMEGAFSYVRVRGELGRVTVAKSGHMYTDLKDDKSVLNSICWKGQVSRLSIRPEEGMEVICTGRITTYPGRSNYQLIIESMELAGEGALLKLLEERKKKLAAEGLFDEARKKPLPFLPEVIGVVTSPTGAVIRDIMHRLYDRFPRHVLLWPVMVQGEGTVKQVTEAIAGFNALVAGGDVPRPDVLIVARGGGSLEDLMPFNDEAIVRAVADSDIPVISAIGHETDTTLIDLVADKRAPTPTGAAEIAVPVHAELAMRLDNNDKRLKHALHRMMTHHKTHVDGLSRGLTHPARLLEQVAQRYDYAASKLDGALVRRLDIGQAHLDRLAGRIVHPRARLQEVERRLTDWAARLTPAVSRQIKQSTDRLDGLSALLKSYSYHGVLERGFALVTGDDGVPVTRAGDTHDGQRVSLTFADGTRGAVIGDGAGGAKPKATKKPAKKSPTSKELKKEQGSLF